MRVVNDEASRTSESGPDPSRRVAGDAVREPARGDQMDDGQRAETRELEDWTLEEEGYGYGV